MNNNTLIELLESVIDDVKNDKYNHLQITYLSSLLHKFTFLTQKNQNIPSNKDLISFLSLGWYIYNNLENY